MSFLQESENIVRLLALGYPQHIIDKYRQTKCIGCGNDRKHCQCPFSGSAHPTKEERFEIVKKELNRLIHTEVEKNDE